jgi:hypothetical protein
MDFQGILPISGASNKAMSALFPSEGEDDSYN